MTPSSASSSAPSKFKKGWMKIAMMVVLFMSASSLVRLVIFPKKSDLPVIAVVPTWSMTNQAGAPFGSENLKGKVYLANFVFSRCPSVCPKMLANTSKLQDEFSNLGEKLSMVSFTVDPDFDKPGILQKLAVKYNARPAVWNFLTSDNKEQMFQLYKDGFKIGVVAAEGPVTDLFDIAHSERIVLVDDRGQIRGYYRYEEASLKQLQIDARALARAL